MRPLHRHQEVLKALALQAYGLALLRREPEGEGLELDSEVVEERGRVDGDPGLLLGVPGEVSDVHRPRGARPVVLDRDDERAALEPELDTASVSRRVAVGFLEEIRQPFGPIDL